jgi:queuine tRNA-ribosyltransferase
MQEIHTAHGALKLPAFLPDATRAVVKGLDSEDLRRCRVEGLVVNTFHLLNSYLANFIADAGGIHRFMDWQAPVLSDSGGFQVMSLIRENPRYGRILRDKVIFRNEQERKIVLTPEKCIQLQLKLGSDIVMCLDDCTRPEDALDQQEQSVSHTVAWAGRCKQEFERLTQGRASKPLIFAIIQGGSEKGLRELCASELIKIGFDGYGFGGFPVDREGALLSEILEFTAGLMPCASPKYAMGVGSPRYLVECFRMGYRLFDCVIPTRDARHKKLYLFKEGGSEIAGLQGDFLDQLYMDNPRLMKDEAPVSSVCGCGLCSRYSRAYLYNLFKHDEGLAVRLASTHNLYFYNQLIDILRGAEREGA